MKHHFIYHFIIIVAKSNSFLELNIYLHYNNFPKPNSITMLQDDKETANLFEISDI